MVEILYKTPLISSILINLLSLFVFIYSIQKGNLIFITFLVIIGVLNRKIIDNGVNLSKWKKYVIYFTFFSMLAVGLIYGFYFIN